MSFAAPGALFMLGLALPIILLYILKVRLRRVPVSTNLFWKQIYDEKPPRSIWQYFRHLISLLIQLLLLALLAFSVADPYFPWQLLQARRIVAVIDNSASMQATDVDPTRFQAAIESAIAMAEGIRFRDQMAIVLSGPTPEVVLGMTSHVPTLKRTLRALAVSDNPTELRPAMELGTKLIGQHPHGQVVVFTDGCQDHVADDLASSERVADPLALAPSLDSPATADVSDVVTEVEDAGNREAGSNVNGEITVAYRIFGKRSPNVGITQFQVRRSLIDPVGYEVLAAVQNASDAPVKCRLEIELDGAPVDVVPLDLEPNGSWSRSIEKTSLEGGTLIGRLTQFRAADSDDELVEITSATGDASSAGAATSNYLTSDDVVQAILPGREIQKVLVVTKGNLFLRKVFEANPLVQVRIAADFPDAWPADTIVVLDRELPEQLPANDLFVVDPVSSCNLWELGELLRDPIVTDQDKDSPLMKHVRLDNVLMPEAHKITIQEKSRTLAGALSKDPVYAEIQREAGGKCLVLTVNLEKSDLAFRTAFPIMVANALGWFAGTNGELQEAVPTGEAVPWEWEGQPGRELHLTSPEGRVKSLHGSEGIATDAATVADAEPDLSPIDPVTVTLGPFDRAGIWSVHETATSEQGSDSAARPADARASLAEFAVNVANGSETDLRPSEALLDNKDTQPLAAGWLARPIWFYLVAAGCLLFVAEWFLYQRRVIA